MAVFAFQADELGHLVMSSCCRGTASCSLGSSTLEMFQHFCRSPCALIGQQDTQSVIHQALVDCLHVDTQASYRQCLTVVEDVGSQPEPNDVHVLKGDKEGLYSSASC